MKCVGLGLLVDAKAAKHAKSREEQQNRNEKELLFFALSAVFALFASGFRTVARPTLSARTQSPVIQRLRTVPWELADEFA